MLKLFVWEGVLTDYYSGLAVALAQTATEAKKLLIEDGIGKERWQGVRLDGVKPSVHTKPVATYIWGGG